MSTASNLHVDENPIPLGFTILIIIVIYSAITLLDGITVS